VTVCLVWGAGARLYR